MKNSLGPANFATMIRDEVLSPQSSPFACGLRIYNVNVGNSSGAAAACGWGYKLASHMWKAYNSDEAAYTDITTAVQAGSTTLGTDGFLVVVSQKPIWSMRMNITTQSDDAMAAEYWNGSAWVALAEIVAIDATSATDQTSFTKIPSAWIPIADGDDLADLGLPLGQYAMRWALDGSVITGTLSNPICLVDYLESVPDGSALDWVSGDSPMPLPVGCNLVPYCATANAQNWVSAQYEQAP